MDLNHINDIFKCTILIELLSLVILLRKIFFGQLGISINVCSSFN